ncbi:hypothetical protein G8S55_01235 [Clostridium botulinum C]|uniref:hypothetical protein n=1 Tax=Clostridium botulinum TaxID=1491 RepID=UPI001E5F9947|nr:hypothetical protein [Clostridium botulinum]MCD3215872.1 hypothetical protein [Clostridium botulinum C]MCD3244340.1 hypothetical protein [Clostridium botulinum C]MCD3260898.1 hypothetical protein [Clostridium botulinum C]
MAKILKVTVNYPQDPKDLKELQDKAMNILARSIVRELPPVAVQELIKKLQEKQ